MAVGVEYWEREGERPGRQVKLAPHVCTILPVFFPEIDGGKVNHL